ncbi:MAG: phage terminase large subunit family protein [Clostridioides sp.]|nr:phage terminase large subunit family protein [Clostridioides sp.]
MKHLYEEVAYLTGLAEGLDIESESKEGKMIKKIIDTLEVFADAIVELSEDQDEIIDHVEAIDEDLDELEESVEDLEDIVDDIIDEDFDDFDDEEEDNELGFLEMECPSCGELVEVDEDLLYDDDVDIVCPNCDSVILSSEDDEHCCCDVCVDNEEE